MDKTAQNGLNTNLEQDQYLEKKFDYIPISSKLIDHVRRLDSFNEEELINLKWQMSMLIRKSVKNFNFNDKSMMSDINLRKFLEITLKLHQIFALVDVNFDAVLTSMSSKTNLQNHYQEIIDQMVTKNGLNYVPRERSEGGRMFEHASDSKVMIDTLQGLIEKQPQKSSSENIGDSTFYVKIIDEICAVATKDSKDKENKLAEDPQMLAEIKLAEKYQQKIYEELKIKQENIVFVINKQFIQLTMKANGKADLYFHAYFWEKYLKSLQENLNKPQNAMVKSQAPVSLPKKNVVPTQTTKKAGVASAQPPEDQKEDGSSAQGDEASEKLDDANSTGTTTAITAPVISTTPLTNTGYKLDISAESHPFMARLAGLSSTLSKVIVNIKKFPFHEKMYQKYATEFGKRQTQKKTKYLEEIQRALFVAQIADDKQGLYWIEKLLIQLQGYCDITIRDQAIVLLNMLYDGVDWQLQEAFRPVVRCVGQHFTVNVIVQAGSEEVDPQIFLGLGAPSPIQSNNLHLLTWHKIEARNVIKSEIVKLDNKSALQLELSINFGKFWKCGFYDWRLVQISGDGKLQPLEIVGKPDPVFPSSNVFDDYYEQDDEKEVGSIAQGRFIVHTRGMRDHSFHEVQLDFQDAVIDKNANAFVQRGTFRDVERSIPAYAKQGITAIYLMGTLERDNYPFESQYHGGTQYRKEDASPLAAIDRSRANKMLGGEEGLKKVMKAAQDHHVKVIVDCLARISSSRHHRKYKNLLLNYLDEDGRRHICYGTDGQAIRFEDTAMLNYRKIEAWELLIDEVADYVQRHGLDGIHLDNGQAWPQIMEPDIEELTRIDVDGQPAYTSEDFMNAEVVLRNENYGYWSSNNMETYPNPFFVKMCKKLWFLNPNFMILGECWGGFMFEHRQIILARSGVIPRLYRLPIALSSVFGKTLHKDGRLERGEKGDASAIIRWHEDSRRFLPEGTILLQSSTAHSLPYPAYLYGKGTWAAIDVLFFMPDVPITFMGELGGEVYRVGQQQTVFQQDQADTSQPNQLKRTNSQIMRILQDGSVDSKQTDMSTTSASTLAPEERRGLPKVRSGVNIGAVYTEVQDGRIAQKEQKFKQELPADQGFDLSQVDTHYIHRRRLRREKMVLRYGELIPLAAKDLQNQPQLDILCYARYSLMETAIIATNLADATKKFVLDLSQLLPTYKKAYSNNTVVMVKSLISDQGEPEYFFLREFIELRQARSLPPFRSLMISVTICDDDQFIFKKCLTNSIERTKRNLLAQQSIETEQISLLFSDCVENNPQDIGRFANVIGSIQHSFLDKLGVEFRSLFVQNSRLSGSVELASRLVAMTGYMLKMAGGQLIAPIRAAQSIHDSNRLGPIVFCTPELGRWSTVGGLGVMVDELAIGLADLGQEVIVISPYYERNRKGQTGYLAQDPAGIHYVDNIRTDIGGGYTLGVHEGVVSGVRVVFLHNGDLFPAPYPDAQPAFVVQQIAVFGKACLEYCCQRQKIPAVCVTNDWFTGLTPAYAKQGHFGDTFKGTTFLHICHNLQESYEGRLHLDPRDGGLEGLHQLPRDWLIDPQWKGNMINPSRCAIMLSDQWATVSKSYRDDLLNSSSLCGLLRQKSLPFAFPNGVPIEERLRGLDKAAPDHITAKRKLQQKYFGFQDLDDSIPLFAFVGRVTAQKGVHLILDAAEQLMQKFDYQIQILVGGPANMREPYAAGCAHKMWHLKNKYPNRFWAAPEEFFLDGALVNRGSDFGLMPSVFEPGGIVQHEFFVGGTPVVAFKTGGLKDSVHEFSWDTEAGSGYTFEGHNVGDFVFAVERAVGTFRNKKKYTKLRENAFKATMDGAVVSQAWLGEFFRLRGKVFVDYSLIAKIQQTFQPWRPQDYTPISIIQEIFGSDKKKQIFQEIDLGANEDEKGNPLLSRIDGSPDRLNELDNIMSAFDAAAFSKKPKAFMLHNRGPRHRRVQLCGSFDEWQTRHDMSFDPFTNQWFITLHLKLGEEYLYKYIVNDSNWVTNDEEPNKKDQGGNVNNYCSTKP